MTFAIQNSYSPRAAARALAPACPGGMIDAGGRRTLLALFQGSNCAVNRCAKASVNRGSHSPKKCLKNAFSYLRFAKQLDVGWVNGWAVFPPDVCKWLKGMVGAEGFEPSTSWSRTRFQAFCGCLHRLADRPYIPGSTCVLNGLRANGFACVCAQLRTLVA